MKKILKRDVELLFEIGCLRHLPRQWQRFFNPDVANNSEHSLRVTWIAWLLAEYEGVKDKEKILKMALIHDIGESRVGDADYLSYQYVDRKETKAMEDISQNTVLQKEIKLLWTEFEKGTSLEAKIIKDADNLDVELELAEQRARGHVNGKLWNSRRQKLIYPTLRTKSAKELWKKIRQAKPSAWHSESNNWLTASNWKKKIVHKSIK